MTTPLPVIANTFRCALRWHQAGGGLTAVNVIHLRSDTAGQTASDAFGAFTAGVSSTMWEGVQAGMSITAMDITPLDGTSATSSFTPAVPGAWTGGSTGDIIIQAAILMKLTTTIRGRANRGRVYLPYPSEGVQSAGVLAGGVRGDMQSAWASCITSMAALTPHWRLGVASYDRAHGGAGAHFTPVLSVQCEALLGTQRKRMSRLR